MTRMAALSGVLMSLLTAACDGSDEAEGAAESPAAEVPAEASGAPSQVPAPEATPDPSPRSSEYVATWIDGELVMCARFEQSGAPLANGPRGMREERLSRPCTEEFPDREILVRCEGMQWPDNPLPLPVDTSFYSRHFYNQEGHSWAGRRGMCESLHGRWYEPG